MADEWSRGQVSTVNEFFCLAPGGLERAGIVIDLCLRCLAVAAGSDGAWHGQAMAHRR